MSEQLFRIGGVYRQEDGDVVELVRGCDAPSDGSLNPDVAWAKCPGSLFGFGFRSLSTGRDVGKFRSQEKRALIPGELHCVNGEWVPFGELIHPASVMHTPYSEDRQSGVRTPVLAPLTPTLVVRKPRPNAAMMLRDATAAATAWREKQQAKADLLAAEQAKRNAPLPCPAGFAYRPDQAPTGHQFGQFKTR